MVVLPTHMNVVVEVSLHLDPRPLGCSMDMRLSRLWIASGTNHIAHWMQIVYVSMRSEVLAMVFSCE